MPPLECARNPFDKAPAGFTIRARPPRRSNKTRQPDERGAMIIDCHGHYTTAPQGAARLPQAPARRAQGPAQQPPPAALKITDDEIRESLEGAQLKLQRERGTDLTIFSPRASGMAHHIGDAATSLRLDAASATT